MQGVGRGGVTPLIPRWHVGVGIVGNGTTASDYLEEEGGRQVSMHIGRDVGGEPHGGAWAGVV